MRGWMISRWPLDRRNTACLARRPTCSIVLPISVVMSRDFLTWRSTSVLRSCTRAMRHPSRRGARSRTIVSTSGSSGTFDLAPRDVASPGLAVERDPLGGRAARRGGRGHGGAEARHTEHATAGGAQSSFVVAVRARLKDDHVVTQIGRVGEPDGDALLRVVGVAPRRKHRGTRGSLDDQHVLALGGTPPPLRDSDEVFAEPRYQRGKEGLRFGVAKTRVELQYGSGPVVLNHQSCVEDTFIGETLRRDFAQHGFEYVGAHARQQRVRGNADRSVG